MSKKILLVDDEVNFLRLFQRSLKDNGFEVITANSGEKALTSAEENNPDLIILDVMMPPGIDGLQAARKLKQNPLTEDIPIIMLTAMTEPDLIRRALEAGAVDYIAKPVQIQVLLEKVRKIFK